MTRTLPAGHHIYRRADHAGHPAPARKEKDVNAHPMQYGLERAQQLRDEAQRDRDARKLCAQHPEKPRLALSRLFQLGRLAG